MTYGSCTMQLFSSVRSIDLSSFKFMPLQLLGGLVKKITEGNNSKTMEARVTVVVHCNSL